MYGRFGIVIVTAGMFVLFCHETPPSCFFSINFLYRILSSVACNCNSNVIQQLTFRRRKKKREQKEQKVTKKKKRRTAFVSWIPKGALSYHQPTKHSNVVYFTKLQLLHSTSLAALGQLQIHSRRIEAAQELDLW